MGFTVVTMTPPAFRAWLAAQRGEAPPTTTTTVPPPTGGTGTTQVPA